MSKSADILVIDDEQVVIDAVTKICALDNYSVDSALGVKSALEKISKNYYRIIICDIMMPDGDGFQILEQLNTYKLESAVIMMTGYSTVENAVKSLYMGAVDFIPKPFTVDELLGSVFRSNKYLIVKKRQEELNNTGNAELAYVTCPAKYLRLGHSTWSYYEKEGSVLIGVCDLFLKTINSVKEINLSQMDDEIVQGISCAEIISADDRLHKILSPHSGRIVEVNENIKSNSSLLEKDPYFAGWIYRLIPSDYDFESKLLVPCSSDR